MRSAVWCFILLFAFIIGSSGGNAFAESKAAKDEPSIAPADRTKNTAVDQFSVARNSSSYASVIKTNAGVHPDPGAVKQTNPDQGVPPSSSEGKAPVRQPISGKKMDCSPSGCVFRR